MADPILGPGSDDPMAQKDIKEDPEGTENDREGVINLPEEDEMRQRLEAVESDDHTREKLFPILLEQAGEEKNAMGIVLMLDQAMYDYSEGSPTVMNTMRLHMESYIDALVKDPTVAQEAKAFYRQSMQ